MQAIKKRKSTEYACFTFPWDFRTVVVGGAVLPWCIHQLILIQTRMVGYKYPHPMPFPAPSPAIASSAAKGVCASIHYSQLLLIWWVALLVFKIPSLFWLLQLHLLVYYNIDGWMTCGVYSDARRGEWWRWGHGVATEGMCGIWDKPTTLPNFESITEITLWGWRLPTFLTVIPTPTNVEPPPALPRRYIIYTSMCI